MELGITHWELCKSRRRHLEVEKPLPQETSGTFIQLKSNGEYVQPSVTAMEHGINLGRELHRQPDMLTVECRTSRGGIELYAKMLERGTFGRPAGLQEDGSLAWRDLVMVVEGIMADKATWRLRLDILRQEAGKI